MKTRPSLLRRLGASALVAVYLSQLAVAAPEPPPGPDAPPPVPLPEYPTGSIVASNAPIMLPGGGGVTDSGGATYTLPLQVPDGPLGMQPSLSLSYGGGGNGPVGVGFGLTGLSSITPCNKTFASEGTADGVDFDVHDSYCLDGQKLVRDGSATPDLEPSDGTDVTLHTEVESFDRVIAHFAPGDTQPERFTVKQRDGRVASYHPICGTRMHGVDSVLPPAQVLAPGCTHKKAGQVAVVYPIRWSQDRSGNRIAYHYTEGADAYGAAEMSYRIESIQYSNTVGNLPRRKIVFGYEGRLDPIVRYLAGVKVVSRTRINTIDAFAPNPTTMQKVWGYQLGYDYSADTGRSRLISVQLKDQFGTTPSWTRRFEWTASTAPLDDHTMPEVEFDDASWSLDAESWEKMLEMAGPEDDPHVAHPELRWVDSTDVRLMLYDIDGDGTDDLLYRTHPTRYRTWEELAVRSGITFSDVGYQYQQGNLRVRRSTVPGLILGERTDVGDYLEPDQNGILWQAHLGKSRVADLDGNGRLDLMLARTRVEENDPVDPDNPIGDPLFDDLWSFGYTNVGSYDPSTGGWDPAMQTQLQRPAIGGPVFADSPSNPEGIDFKLFTPPFQHVLADLDGDGITDDVDAFYHQDPIDILDHPDESWYDLESYHQPFPYFSVLSTDPIATPRLFTDPTGGPSAYWTCNNGNAIVTDYEGDGRADVLAATDTEIDPSAAVTARGIYARLHTADIDHLQFTQDFGELHTEPSTALWGGDCGQHDPDVVMGDFNGDGLEDLLYPPRSYLVPDPSPPPGELPELEPNLVPLVRWNLGNGFGPVEPMPVDNAALGERMYSEQPGNRAGLPVGWDRGTRAVDLNHDGRTDILAMRFDDPDFLDTAAGWRGSKIVIAYLSVGDSFVAKKLATWDDAQMSFAEGFSAFQVGDVTGDGAQDIVHVDAGKIVVTELPWRKRADLLEHVKDDGAAYPLEVFGYDSAWWGGGGRPAAPAAASCAYPRSCIRRGFPVVQQHAVFVGTKPGGGARYRETLHSFAEPRSDLRGRGFLGFATHRIWDRQLGAETLRNFDNVTRVDDNESSPGGEFYPFAMVAAYVKTTTPDELLPSAAEMMSHPNFPGASAGDQHYGMVRTTARYQTYEVRWADAGRVMTRLPSTWSQTERDVDAFAEDLYQSAPHYTWWGNAPADERVTAGSAVYDPYGNPLMETSTTVDGVTTVVTRTFDTTPARIDDWLLGLMTREERRSTDGMSPHGQAASRVVRTSHDSLGRPDQILVRAEAAGSDCLETDVSCELAGNATKLTYSNAHGNLVWIEVTAPDDPTVRKTRIVYDPEGVYPAQVTDPLGFVSTSLLHPAFGVPVLDLDVIGVATTRQYDGFGRLRKVMQPGTATATRGYTPFTAGDQIGIRIDDAELGIGSASYARSELGRTIETGSKGFGGVWAYQETEYDHFGNVVRQSNPSAALPATVSARAVFDRLGRPIRSIGPDDATTERTHTMFSTTTFDPGGHESYVDRDVDGRVIESGHLVDAGGTKYGEVELRYDPYGQVTRVIDASDNITAQYYDPFGRLTKHVDPDTGVSQLGYDGFGQLTSEERADGETIKREYDALGRLTTATGPDGTETRIYDVGIGAAHQLSAVTSIDDVTTALTYDTLGRLHELAQTVDGTTLSSVQRYDGYGRLAYLFYPEVPGFDRFTVGYSYGTGGHLASLRDASTCHVSTDPNVPAPACAPPKLWEVTGRNAQMALTGATYGNSKWEVRLYDAQTGRQTQLSAPGIGIAYSYDEDGNLSERRDLVQTGRIETFGYDDLHRLTRWTLKPPKDRKGNDLPEVGTEYHYDELGNLDHVEKDGVESFDGTFGWQGKPHALASISTGGAYTYDALGRQETGGGREIRWNHLDRPAWITENGDTRWFRYDAFGDRVIREDAASKVTYLTKLYEHRESVMTGISDTFLVHGEPGVVAQVDYTSQGKATRYVVGDPLASASLVMLGAANVERAYFAPFGDRIDVNGDPIADPDPRTTFGFTNHEEDDANLVNMRGRIYDRDQYRFLSPDPIIADPLFGQSYNPYSYVLNNPLRFTDPTGYQAVEPENWVEVDRHSDAESETTVFKKDACPSGPPCTMAPEPPANIGADESRSNGSTNDPVGFVDLSKMTANEITMYWKTPHVVFEPLEEFENQSNWGLGQHQQIGFADESGRPREWTALDTTMHVAMDVTLLLLTEGAYSRVLASRWAAIPAGALFAKTPVVKVAAAASIPARYRPALSQKTQDKITARGRGPLPPLRPGQRPQFGHKPGFENKALVENARKLGMTKQQLTEFVNKHDEYFFIQGHSSNASRNMDLGTLAPQAVKDMFTFMKTCK